MVLDWHHEVFIFYVELGILIIWSFFFSQLKIVVALIIIIHYNMSVKERSSCMKSKVKASMLREIINDVYTSKTLSEALQIVEKHLTNPESTVRESDRSMMLAKARTCPTLLRLQTYLTNSLLYFEKLGV